MIPDGADLRLFAWLSHLVPLRGWRDPHRGGDSVEPTWLFGLRERLRAILQDPRQEVFVQFHWAIPLILDPPAAAVGFRRRSVYTEGLPITHTWRCVRLVPHHPLDISGCRSRNALIGLVIVRRRFVGQLAEQDDLTPEHLKSSQWRSIKMARQLTYLFVNNGPPCSFD